MSFRTVLILSLAALTLGAQGAQGRHRPERPRPGPPERRAAPRRERIMAQLHDIRARKLQHSLGLTDDRAKSIADRWSRFDEDSLSRRQQTGELRQQMNATLVGPGTEAEKNKKLQPVIEQLTGLRQQQQEARKRFEEDIQGSLTPAQQGRFILLMDEFQKSIQEAIQEHRKDTPEP